MGLGRNFELSFHMASFPKILIVDDHSEIRKSVASYLNENGMRAIVASNSTEMDLRLAELNVDLIVLDVMMPNEDGLTACERLRDANQNTPVLMLSALSEDIDRISGLNVGADDYLAKPFNPKELLARIRAILRRSNEAVVRPQIPLAGKQVKFGGIVFDYDSRKVTRINSSTEILTNAEVKLLSIFLSRPREVLDRDKLLSLSSGRKAGPLDRTIDNQISRLRRKIEPDVLRPRIITTVRNGGYQLSCDVEIQTQC